MVFRMLFGMAVSSGLAWGVLRLFGSFHAITPFGIVVGVLLTALYFAAFRSGMTGRTRGKAVTEQETAAGKEIEGREEEVLQPAA